ncbi:UDP-4-amino-4,6-dideoxy-N-acetyl-beta-L-altrosamine transaminase [Candidatus Pacearchaeota archaeon CG1_02_32_132]|nr:MAG: UDP-4-amino-4,6-dideoxy-N-acetyl-beta-L-altrosamine transaminase [Candidatus Pacearchaeota archaeon CG1_02_32_132]
MDKIIPYQRQFIDEKDIEAVVQTLKSDFITTGPKVKEFEQRFAEYVGAKYAIAISNGTAALHLACLASGLKYGDELITSPLTFLASSNCALYCGAKPIFTEIDNQGLIDLKDISNKTNEKTKIIIPVHYGGLPFNTKKLRESFNGIIIEDAAHALGAKNGTEKIGSCTHSDMCIFSFHPVKHITTGEGGMITTNSEELYKKLIVLRSHGIDPSKKTEDEPWGTPMVSLGYNYRITDIQCALGLSQLDKVDGFIMASRKLAERYDRAFADNKDIRTIKEKEGQFNSYHLYPILVGNSKVRLDLYNYLRKNNIFAQIHYKPVYLQPYYQSLGYEKGLCPKAEEFYNQVLSLPIYPQLTEEDQDFVVRKINEFFEE